MTARTGAGFTLIELLVVITIIVVLLALLVPAMDTAVTVAEKAICLANQRTIVQGCQFYAANNRGHWPYWPDNEQPSAYDWRTPWNIAGSAAPMQQGLGDPLKPAGFGQLPANGYLPTTKLGKVAHCPNIDSSTAAAGVRFVGMDRPWISNWGAGGSHWVDRAWNMRRILGSYNYRAASWFHAGKGWIRTGKVGASDIICIDMPDVRFGGVRFIHPDGYNRVFADGHGAFFFDPNREAEAIILGYTGGVGDVAGHNTTRGLQEETQLYPFLAYQR